MHAIIAMIKIAMAYSVFIFDTPPYDEDYFS